MPTVLKGRKMKCPKCGGTDNLVRNEIVLRSVHIKVNSKGKWDWDGVDDVHWETSDYRKELQNESEWRCRFCDIDFDAPNVKPA